MMDTVAFITPVYAGFFGIMLVFLSWRVTKLRRKYDTKMGESGHGEMTAAVRAQGSLVEHLPMALLLMWMLENMLFSPWILHGLGIALVIARLMHLHGLSDPSHAGIGRKLGTRLTWAHIVVCSLLGFAGAFGVIV